MGPVEESAVPPAHKAKQAFIDAMDNWDESAADVAAVGLARHLKPAQIFELLCRYGARDFRSIGHKAIFVANSWRTLRHIGWQHVEPLLRQPGIVALHAVTSTNALYHAFQASRSDENRRLLLLQNTAFLPLFRDPGYASARTREVCIDKLDQVPLQGEVGLEEIFIGVSRDPLTAARKVLAFFGQTADTKGFIDAARVLVFLKGNDSHDYKFSSAVLEDCDQLPLPWRARYLAASVFSLRGSEGPDNDLVARTRAALKG